MTQLEQAQAAFIGRTVKQFNLIPLNMDGSGPVSLSIIFNDDYRLSVVLDVETVLRLAGTRSSLEYTIGRHVRAISFGEDWR